MCKALEINVARHAGISKRTFLFSDLFVLKIFTKSKFLFENSIQKVKNNFKKKGRYMNEPQKKVENKNNRASGPDLLVHI